jgi:hypothetical protein
MPMPRAVMLIVLYADPHSLLSVIKLSDIVLSVFMLSVVMLRAIMTNVVAPSFGECFSLARKYKTRG